MNVNIVYDPSHKDKNKIIKVIKVVNCIQNRYRLIDCSEKYLDYPIYDERKIGTCQCGFEMQMKVKNYHIFIVDVLYEEIGDFLESEYYRIIQTLFWRKTFSRLPIESYLLNQIGKAFLEFQADIRDVILKVKMMHIYPTGCINDRCDKKTDMKCSILGGYICQSCRETYIQHGMEKEDLEAVELIIEAARLEALGRPLPVDLNQDNKSVFIVHGRNEEILMMVVDYIKSIGLKPIVLKHLTTKGVKPILTQISENGNVKTAIFIYTADDEGRLQIPAGGESLIMDHGKLKKEYQLQPRARQNVVFESGYFLGKLGDTQVLMLVEDQEIEIPSDIGGCLFIEFDQHESWKKSLSDSLKGMGMDVD